MNKGISIIISGLALMAGMTAHGQNQGVIVETRAYTWADDTISQGEYKAFAPSDTRIVSTYKAQPGYYMPVSAEWNLKNDISG